MQCVYVLCSQKDGKRYIGCTNDLRRRLSDHNDGLVESTKQRIPLKLIYYEGCLNPRDAFHREKYLKSTYGHRYIRNRLRYYFTGQ